jgi:hypothetical protein
MESKHWLILNHSKTLLLYTLLIHGVSLIGFDRRDLSEEILVEIVFHGSDFGGFAVKTDSFLRVGCVTVSFQA